MNTEAQHTESPMTPGQRLRQAREQLGYSQAQVAERLCLKNSVVRALEEDTLTSELAPTFIRGYVRSYARLVNLPEQEMVAAINAVLPAEPAPQRNMQSFSSKKERRSHDNRLMLFTWVLLFVVISLTGLWWWQNHQAQQAELEKMTSTLPPAEQSQTISETPAVPVPEDATTNANNVSGTATAPATDANGAPLAPTAGVASAATPATAQGATAPLAANAAQPAVAEINGQPVALNADGNPVAPVTTPAEEAAAEVATAGALNLEFTGDCWLEIKDATGQKLTSGLQKQGAKLSLSGTPPYRLTIGAPGAVNLSFEGKPVDLSRYAASGRVARFTLPLTE